MGDQRGAQEENKGFEHNVILGEEKELVRIVRVH